MPLAKMARRWLGRFEDVPLAAMAGFHGAPGAVQVART